MDFFNTACQQGPYNNETFGLCDDQNTTIAYVDTTTPEKWIATVENTAKKEVVFTAIDKCVINDSDVEGRGRCDGMLTTENLIFLVELKDQRSSWITHAVEQLESTIRFLKENHDISRFRHKKAFACNKRHRSFVEIDNEQNKRFHREHGFRLDIQATILIIS